MVKSLRSTGNAQAARAFARCWSAPWKKSRSVSTESAAAPPASYSRAMTAGSNSSRSRPLLGDARFISAMTAARPSSMRARSASANGRGGGMLAARSPSSRMLTRALRSVISSALRAIIFLRISGVSGGMGRRKNQKLLLSSTSLANRSRAAPLESDSRANPTPAFKLPARPEA